MRGGVPGIATDIGSLERNDMPPHEGLAPLAPRRPPERYPDRYRVGIHYAAALVTGRRDLGFAERVPRTATPPVRAEVKHRGTCGWTSTLGQWLPRLINRTAHYALTAAAAKGARTVTAEHLEHAVAELRL